MSKQSFCLSFALLLLPLPLLAQQYDPLKAIAYAERWWNDFNNENNKDTIAKWGGPYIDYTSYGGDCAAFVSVVIKNRWGATVQNYETNVNEDCFIPY